jgi:dolichol kinase
MWPEIKRKLFHMVALIYVVGVITLPRRQLILLLIVLFIAEFSFELARMKIGFLREWFLSHFHGLLRTEEEQTLSGVFWMLGGVLTTVLLIPPVPVAVAVLLYLILGDGAASLIGMRLGGPHWPHSKKRLSGSLACLVVCLIAGVVLLRPQYGWSGIVVGALTATVFELGILPVNDNFLIPAASSIAMIICYGIWPIL